MELSPIILFVYNRPIHTQKTIEALQLNELASKSILYIFSDGPKNSATKEQIQQIQEVRKYIHTINGFKEIHIQESNTNKGLANSIISGVSDVIQKYRKAIILEDDIVTNRFFLRFMNEALDFYQYDKRIFCVGAFNYNFPIPSSYKKDVYIVHRAESCGWGTWSEKWNTTDWMVSDYEKFCHHKRMIKKFNRGGNDMAPMLKAQMDGKIDSWAIRWDYCLYKHNAYCVRPIHSLVYNIGFDGSGIHCGIENENVYNASFYDSKSYNIIFPPKININKRMERAFKRYFTNTPTLYERLKYSIDKRIYYIMNKYGFRQSLIADIGTSINTTRIGNAYYGSFNIFPDQLNQSSIVYSFGLGEDISFDLEIIKIYGCQVYGFDPTPKTIEYIQQQQLLTNFHFMPIGISIANNTEKWFLPRNTTHVSCSVHNREKYFRREKKDNTILVKVCDLQSIMDKYNHDHIDLLKLDIEGSEYSVLPNSLKSNLNIGQITLEFHPQSIRLGVYRTNKIIHLLQQNGYSIISVNTREREYTFLKTK